jgi:hypothetical protein
MTAEPLRQAAAKMRERAEAATPGPWIPLGQSIAVEGERCNCGVSGEAAALYGHEPMCRLEGPIVQADVSDIEHIASWHPAVALLVAKILTHEADIEEQYGAPASTLAVDLAHEYLGDPVTVHACPEGDSGATPCCGHTPFDLPGDRMTLDPALVTCQGGA